MATAVFKNAKTANVATSGSTVYTVPSGKYSVIHAIYVTNIYNLEDLYVNIEVVDASSAPFNIAYLYPISANLGAVWERPINLMSQEVLKITSSRANSLDVFVSYLEFTP